MNDICALRERAKELRCLYSLDAVFADRAQTPVNVFLRVVQEIPAGWQRPESTGARIEYLGRSYVGPGFTNDGQMMSEPIRLWGSEIGRVSVSVREPEATDQLFLEDEAELLRRIAGRLEEYLDWKHAELLGERPASVRNHWAWRQRFAEALADNIQPARWGVSRMFIGGSTSRGDAGPASDIDLYIIFAGSDQQKRDLSLWLEGWSRCLGEVALLQTGQPFPDGVLNVQWLASEPSIWQRAELHELKLGNSVGANPRDTKSSDVADVRGD
ncbi:MAG: nucleotidyltransferase domain-containing protein [Pirellulaceae bacterium]